MSKKKLKHQKLNQVFATAICGNDILSSALYVSGIAIIFVGVYAPLVLGAVALVLYCYKAVYTEVVEALPINGGAYNCLLNGTGKPFAAVAGVMTILSYIATAVISANIGVKYLNTIVPSVPVITTTLALLLGFALLVVAGIKDSAKVAFAIFAFHIITLVSFVVIGAIYYFSGHSVFALNLDLTHTVITSAGGLKEALFLGFCASLLGVSGFESSANFVEEQDKGVFRKTLRNMLIGVTIFNPLIALIILNAMPYGDIQIAKDFLLSDAAQVIGGSIFQYIVVIDAFLVLAGAVLTSYVGVSGLMQRMALDAALPNWLAKKNKRGSYPRIIFTFFVLCASILLITKGNLLSLAGVYSIAFLNVMTFFAVGNIILRMTRPDLKRTYHAPFLLICVAAFATFFGILGNVQIDPNNFIYFGVYFVPAIALVMAVIFKDYVLRFFMRVTARWPWLNYQIRKRFEVVIEDKFVAFIYNTERLYEIMRYIYRNEVGRNIILVHCHDADPDHSTTYQEIKAAIPVLQHGGVFPHLKIHLMYKQKAFGPEAVSEVAHDLKIPTNRIFIGSLHMHHTFTYEQFGGVRIIF